MKITIKFIPTEYYLVSSIMKYSILNDRPIRILYINPLEWEL